VLYKHGVLSKAVSLAEEALKVAESVFDKNHPNIAKSLDSMALICYSQGRHFEKALLEEVSPGLAVKTTRRDKSNIQESMNRVVVSNFAKHKYTEAESLYRRALKIKYKNYNSDHPEVKKSLDKLAELYNFQGKYAEAESLLRSARLQTAAPPQRIQPAVKENRDRDSQESTMFQVANRSGGSFPVAISSDGSTVLTKGSSEIFNDSGTLIKTRDWRKFKMNDQIQVTVFIPSPLAKHGGTIGLQGAGQVTGIDEDDEAVTVEFVGGLRQVAQGKGLEVAGKVRYKKLAYYLSVMEGSPIADFEKEYPNGFLVEKSQSIFDNNVMFQFCTRRIEDEDVLSLQENTNVLAADILELRVLEVRKKKSDIAMDVITIGRSANNDIVLYNKLISKSHACLHISSQDDSIYMVDFGSTNGTFLNGNELVPQEKYLLHNGDEIALGPETTVIYFSAKAFSDFITTTTSCSS
jgi:hypothetical protein